MYFVNVGEKEQQRVAVGPENGGNSFLVARWRPPQAAACPSAAAAPAAAATDTAEAGAVAAAAAAGAAS